MTVQINKKTPQENSCGVFLSSSINELNELKELNESGESMYRQGAAQLCIVHYEF